MLRSIFSEDQYHRSMNVLATPWLPNLNPIGVPSILAASLCLLLAALTSRFSGVSRRGRMMITRLAPFVLGGVSAFTEGSLVNALCFGGRSLYYADADDYLAGIILLVFGFVFALHCFNFLTLYSRLVGWIFTLFYGSLITFHTTISVIALPWILRRYSRYNWSVAGLFAVVLFVLFWIPVLVILDRRKRRELSRAKGCCVRCGYNLTGNVSGTCPECGLRMTPIEEE